MKLLLKNKAWNIYVKDERINKNNGYILIKSNSCKPLYKYKCIVGYTLAKIQICGKNSTMQLRADLMWNDTLRGWQLKLTNPLARYEKNPKDLSKQQTDYILREIYKITKVREGNNFTIIK